MINNAPKSKKKRTLLLKHKMTQSILSHLIVGAVCLYIGIMIGLGNQMSRVVEDAIGPAKLLHNPHHQIIRDVNCTSHLPVETATQTDVRQPLQQNQQQQILKQQQQQQQQQPLARRKRPFPTTSEKVFSDFATVSRDAFTELLDLGVPLDETTKGAQDVLVLYNGGPSMPQGLGWKHDKIGIEPSKALENCLEVKVILQEPAKKDGGQCIAIVPQWESYVVHKWMRVPPEALSQNTTVANIKYPLQSVPRIRQSNGVGYYAGIPKETKTLESNELLIQYLRNRSRVLPNLKTFFKTIMGQSQNPSLQALVILTCNKGQAELFRNFVCNAKAKGLDLSHVILFATDEYTANLSKELGVHVWYDAGIFGSIPQESAKKYGDQTFSRTMMAKVYCMDLAMRSGYDLLFQDVDVVWHKDPLPYLKTSPEFRDMDMVFQDDGSRTWRYAPYSPNSGFYFVRNTPVTKYFFETLLKMGDMIQAAKSHQHVLNDLLIDFSSSKGLRIKVVRKGKTNVFPGGVEFHNQKDYMKKLFTGETTPYVFHMSWTNNKENKKKFLEQLGEWYVPADGSTGLGSCLATPNITCHYRDKPSKIPCLDSPRIDGDQTKNVSFW